MLEPLESRIHLATAQAFVRINQVGYIRHEAKTAVLISSVDEAEGFFSVDDAHTHRRQFVGSIGASMGRWNANYHFTYLLTFGNLTRQAHYRIRFHGPVYAESPKFRIAGAGALYAPLLVNIPLFYAAQEDGPTVDSDVLDRQPSHLADESASVYATPTYSDDTLQGTLKKIGGPVDLSGGWFDAGDFIKLTETTSYADAMLLIAARDYPSIFDGGGESIAGQALYGLEWLAKMWNQQTKTLYSQVGIGDGNGSTILGDHDVWRLPQADDQLNVKPGDPEYFVKYRPVFLANSPGGPISPNLAGRVAADFALGFQLYRKSNPGFANQLLLDAETIFDLAKTTNVGQLVTANPYDYYPETEWRDDMELGATELYLATAAGGLPKGLPHTDPSFYLSSAAHWAHAYITGPGDGADTLNLYDVSGVAHHELFDALTDAGSPTNLAVTKSDLVADLKSQLDGAVATAQSDPFGLGFGYDDGDVVPHAIGLAIEAGFYGDMTGSSAYAGFAQTQRNFVLGQNAWGSTYIVGAGTVFPTQLQHQVANLVGTLNGQLPILLGAVVDGPNDAESVEDAIAGGPLDGMKLPSGNPSEPFAQFSSQEVIYADNVLSYPTVEPALDYTALTPLLFAMQK